MITREDIEKLSIDQMGQSLERDTVVYGESLHSMSKEELEKEENELIKQMDEYDHYLCEVKYELPDSVILIIRIIHVLRLQEKLCIL